jgi:hypothetical protein
LPQQEIVVVGDFAVHAYQEGTSEDDVNPVDEGFLVGLVEFFHTHADSMKVLECTSWKGKAFNLVGEGLLVCKIKFNLSLLDYGTI